MNWQEFLVSVLEYAIANIPTLVAIVFFHLRKFKVVENQVGQIDLSVIKTRKDIVETVDLKVSNILDSVDKRFEKTIDKVGNVLDGIENTVEGFERELKSQKNQISHLFKTQKTLLEVIGILVSKDDKLVSIGVAKMINDKTSFSQEEMKKYPELTKENSITFEQMLKDQYALLGKVNFEELLLETVGELYEKEEREE